MRQEYIDVVLQHRKRWLRVRIILMLLQAMSLIAMAGCELEGAYICGFLAACWVFSETKAWTCHRAYTLEVMGRLANTETHSEYLKKLIGVRDDIIRGP